MAWFCPSLKGCLYGISFYYNSYFLFWRAYCHRDFSSLQTTQTNTRLAFNPLTLTPTQTANIHSLCRSDSLVLEQLPVRSHLKQARTHLLSHISSMMPTSTQCNRDQNISSSKVEEKSNYPIRCTCHTFLLIGDLLQIRRFINLTRISNIRKSCRYTSQLMPVKGHLGLAPR